MLRASLLLCCSLAAVTLGAQAPAAVDGDARPSFSAWLEGVRAEAAQRGIRQEIIDEALGSVVEPLPVVIERDRSQAETVLSLEAYLKRRLTKALLRRGRDMVTAHRHDLEEVSAKYGVPVAIISGIWGI